MPASFQPKFVDLVRNYTSTSGTANFVLGTAVPGFQSLGAALGAGDQFFYCVMGIDKPAEREVGRGTLMPNGTVARDAISGAPTNFSSGAKTLSLVVAAEYYDLLRQHIAGGASDLSGLATSNKTSLVAALNEIAAGAGESAAPTFAAASGATISGNQVVTTGHGEAGKGGARYIFSAAVDAAYVAANPRSAFIAAGGRGFRIDRTQRVSPQMLGAKGDGTSDDLAALQAWLDLGGDLFLPADHFYCSAKLIARRQVNVRGAGYSFDRRQTTVGAMAGSRIRFAAGVGGIQVQNFAALASGETVLSSPPASINTATVQEGAALSSFRDFHLISDSNSSGAGIGFDARTVVHVENVTARSFGDEGFVIQGSADVPDAPVPYGNTALSTLRACHAIECGSHGFWQRGRDAGPVHYDTNDAILCGGWGFVDESSYGGKYSNCHAATNSAGAYRATSLIAGSVYDNCYVESGTGSNSDLPISCTIIGGLLSTEGNGNTNTSPAGRIGFGKAAMQLFKAVKGEGNNAAVYPISAAAYYYHHTAVGAVVAGSGASSDVTIINAAGTTVANVQAGGTRWNAAVGFSVGGTPVIGARGAAVADATDAASAITQLNALLSRCRAHGLIA